MTTESPEPQVSGAAQFPDVHPERKVYCQNWPLPSLLGHPEHVPAQTARAAAGPCPVAEDVYSPGATGDTRTVPVVTVLSPLVMVRVPGPEAALLGIR